MTDRSDLIAAYERLEREAIAAAERQLGRLGPKGIVTIGIEGIRQCAEAAALECGVAWSEAREALGRHFVTGAN